MQYISNCIHKLQSINAAFDLWIQKSSTKESGPKKLSLTAEIVQVEMYVNNRWQMPS